MTGMRKSADADDTQRTPEYIREIAGGIQGLRCLMPYQGERPYLPLLAVLVLVRYRTDVVRVSASISAGYSA